MDDLSVLVGMHLVCRVSGSRLYRAPLGLRFDTGVEDSFLQNIEAGPRIEDLQDEDVFRSSTLRTSILCSNGMLNGSRTQDVLTSISLWHAD